jgi:plastocyanin
MDSDKRGLIIGILILILILAGGTYLFRAKPKPSSSNSTANQQDASVTQTPTETSTPSPLAVDATLEAGITTTPVAISSTQSISVEGGSFYFKPNEIRVKKGDTVKVTLTGVGDMTHNFVLDDFNVKSSDVEDGDSTTFQFTADKSGTFEYYCSHGEHREKGQIGKLIVE